MKSMTNGLSNKDFFHQDGLLPHPDCTLGVIEC